MVSGCSEAPEQQWQIMSSGEVHNQASGTCLDAALGTLGRHGYTNGCVGGGVGQLWRFDGGALELRSAQTCLDAVTCAMAKCGVAGATQGVWAVPQ